MTQKMVYGGLTRAPRGIFFDPEETETPSGAAPTDPPEEGKSTPTPPTSTSQGDQVFEVPGPDGRLYKLNRDEMSQLAYYGLSRAMQEQEKEPEEEPEEEPTQKSKSAKDPVAALAEKFDALQARLEGKDKQAQVQQIQSDVTRMMNEQAKSYNLDGFFAEAIQNVVINKTIASGGNLKKIPEFYKEAVTELNKQLDGKHKAYIQDKINKRNVIVDSGSGSAPSFQEMNLKASDMGTPKMRQMIKAFLSNKEQFSEG